MPLIIHWFRRDLRLHDNTALIAAAHASGGAVVPVFIFDPTLLQGRFVGAARVRFMLESLQILDQALRERGSMLIVRHGDPQQQLFRLIEESGATGVYWNRDYSPYAVARDTAIKTALHTAGYTACSFKDAVIWEINEVVKQDGTPYTVFTPYARRWRQHLDETGVQVNDHLDLQGTLDLPATRLIPTLHDLGLHTEQHPILAGEPAGYRLLQQFTDLRHNNAIARYHTQRDVPAIPGTSRLSAHLRLGSISPRACLRAALDVLQHHADADSAAGVNAWINELAWRDFYVQILYHFPHVLRGAFKPRYDALCWDNKEELFAAWCAGRTGYPIVDAAMRQLNQEAWMHNRSRMIVASFLTKDLLIDWRWGECYFMQYLVDGDPAANNGGWQWAAGTGTDAQPYFRIFNPISQGKKCDPHGDYVRRYVPELADVPDKYIHAPWSMPEDLQRTVGIRMGFDYPLPIVDHATQRQRTLAIYAAVRKEQDGSTSS